MLLNFFAQLFMKNVSCISSVPNKDKACASFESVAKPARQFGHAMQI